MTYTREEISGYVKATRRIARKIPTDQASAFFKQSYEVFESLDAETRSLFVSVFEQLTAETFAKADEILKESKDFRQNESI